MGDLFYALDKGFQRLLRWIYPGILFLILWYASNSKNFITVSEDFGFPSDTIWGLLIGALGIGAVIYLLQQYVFTTFLNLIHHFRGRPIPYNYEKSKYRSIRWLDRQAELIREKSKEEPRLDAYMDYNWSIFHALCITAWLTNAFYWTCDKQSSILSCLSPLYIIIFSVVLGVFAYYWYLRLIRASRPKQR